jgi:hypothetical protein
MEGYCSTGQSPQRAVVPVEEEEEYGCIRSIQFTVCVFILVNFFCLFGLDEFYVHGTYYRRNR